MNRDPRYDILFEPVKIGPVTTKNRFFQVPHCNGMGHQYPSGMAAMRRMKAEGGWGVINTEEMEISYTSELTPVPEVRLWDDSDMPALQKMVDGVHEYGALAGTELAHLGGDTANYYSREIPVGPSQRPIDLPDPIQTRRMDKSDIRAVRKMHVDAALRCRKIGFDLLELYSGHKMSTFTQFMNPDLNDRGDEYGGSLENRVRFLRETFQDVKDAVGHDCAIGIRMGLNIVEDDNGRRLEEESREIVEMMAELPDLWDVHLGDWPFDSSPSRFEAQGWQDEHIAFVKKVTGKPVVGVGRFTSPDAMVSLIKNGRLDLIGAARPSIADPFLPKKIEEGRIEDIRECIGCNICVVGDFLAVPSRCTQNPTMGEEWRRGWHPEKIDPIKKPTKVLVVGGGASGLEAARALGQRGCDVTLSEARADLGGRVIDDSQLPGLAEWRRAVDYRIYQISQMANVHTFTNSALSASEVQEFGADHIVLATGAKWARNGVGRSNQTPIEISDDANVLTPDDIKSGVNPTGPVVIFDDELYYMAGVLAEKLRLEGFDVTYVTPAPDVSTWTHNTMEQERIQTRLIKLGVKIIPLHNLTRIEKTHVELADVYADQRQNVACQTTILVTMRHSVDALYLALTADDNMTPDDISRIGDCFSPGTIAASIYSGHKFAREFGEPVKEGVPFRRELPAVADD